MGDKEEAFRELANRFRDRASDLEGSLADESLERGKRTELENCAVRIEAVLDDFDSEE